MLDYALEVCTIIIKRQEFFNEVYYIDLFAGPGLNELKGGKKDALIGSPFIAALNYADVYTSMIFCESDSSFAKTLKLRMATLGKNNIQIRLTPCESCLNQM